MIVPVPTPDTHTRPPIAKTVVWRHPCNCPSASRPLEPGEQPEHRFDVDGDPFPWYIAENGASFVKHLGVYLVKVEIFPIEYDGNRDVLDITLSYWRRQPRIGDRLFPWAILDGSINADVAAGAFPVLHLTFIAESVDADIDIPDLDIWTARTPHEADIARRAREHERQGAKWRQEHPYAADVVEAINAPDLDVVIDAAEDRDA